MACIVCGSRTPNRRCRDCQLANKWEQQVDAERRAREREEADDD